MTVNWGEVVGTQFGAAIDMLDNAISACPESLWGAVNQRDAFWYIAYHAMFWLDVYLYGSEEGFMPPAPFMLVEADSAEGPLPDRVYTKDELRGYLDQCRQKLRATVNGLTDEKASQRCTFGWGEVSFAELLLYNMRHVQEHASQLSFLLGEKVGSAPGWVGRAKKR